MLTALFYWCGNWGDPDGFWLCERCLYAASAPHHILGVGMRIDIDLLKPINIKSSACTEVSPQAQVICQAAAVGVRTSRVLLHFQGHPPRLAHRQPQEMPGVNEWALLVRLSVRPALTVHCTWSEHTGFGIHSAPQPDCSQYFLDSQRQAACLPLNPTLPWDIEQAYIFIVVVKYLTQALAMLGKYSTTELYPNSNYFCFNILMYYVICVCAHVGTCMCRGQWSTLGVFPWSLSLLCVLSLF